MFQVGSESRERNVLALRGKDSIIGPEPNDEKAYSRDVSLFLLFGENL